MPSKACVIGAGFSSLSAACHLAKAGFEVTVLEKNDGPGGRARKFSEKGFHFDMGPSWYWMPDVFEHFFHQFGKSPSDYYDLIRLDPSYVVNFDDGPVQIPADMVAFEALCESIEPGSSHQLRKFLSQAEYKYQVGINDLVYKPSRSLTEFLDYRLLYGLLKMDVFTSMRAHVHKFFKSQKLRQLMEFPILFLGATPQNTPALYSLMNYADISLGTWYPMGGMYKVVEGMVKLAEELGVQFKYNQEVTSFEYGGRSVRSLVTTTDEFECNVVVAGADYQYIDQHILAADYQNYSSKYWNSRVMAPSSLIFYIGLDKKLPDMFHHVLFFDEDFDQHAKEIYEHPQWPTKPLLYTSVTSRTDSSTAPANGENLFILIPVAPDLDDNPETRDRYLHMPRDKLESFNQCDIRSNLSFCRSFAHNDFIADYHSFKGNAYGLANTLMQTAILKPSLKNKHLNNLYFTGQLTVPGPGVPPSLISGEVIAREIAKDFG